MNLRKDHYWKLSRKRLLVSRRSHDKSGQCHCKRLRFPSRLAKDAKLRLGYLSQAQTVFHPAVVLSALTGLLLVNRNRKFKESVHVLISDCEGSRWIDDHGRPFRIIIIIFLKDLEEWNGKDCPFLYKVLKASKRWITRFVVRWRTQLNALINVNCRHIEH